MADTGNMKAMREALIMCADSARCIIKYAGTNSRIASEAQVIVDAASHALEEPPRQCDIGTAEEQNNRHGLWCSKHDVNGDMEADCANNACSQCILKWAQMPYTESEAEKDISKPRPATKQEIGDGKVDTKTNANSYLQR